MDTPDLHDLVRQQQQTIDELRARLDRLEAEPSPTTDPSPATNAVSRRALFGLAGAGIAGTVLGASATPAAAADGDPVLLGTVNEATSATQIDVAATSIVGFLVEHPGDGEYGGGIAIRGHGPQGVLGTGLPAGPELGGVGVAGEGEGPFGFGVSGTSDFVGVLGENIAEGPSTGPAFGVAGLSDIGPAVAGESVASYGGAFYSDGPQLHLGPRSEPGATGPPTGPGELGSFFADAAGDLYFCTSGGEPATWTRLNHQVPTYFDTPQRGYDSRQSGGRFDAGQTRTVDLAAQTDLPTDAASAIVTVTVTGTTGTGFVSVYSDGVPVQDPPAFATLTWTANGQTLSTTAPVRLDQGRIKVYAHRASHVVVDVVGHQDARTPAEVVAAAAARAVEANGPARVSLAERLRR